MHRIPYYIGLFIPIFTFCYSVNIDDDELGLSSLLSIVTFIAIIVFER